MRYQATKGQNVFERLTANLSPRQFVYRAGFPLLVFLGAWLLLDNVALIPESYMELFAVSPFLLLLLVIALTYRFNQARVLVISLSLIVAYWGVRTFLQQSLTVPVAHYVYTAIGLILPCNFLLAFIFPERGIAHWSCAVQVLLIPVEAGLLWLAWNTALFQLPELFAGFVAHPFDGYVMPRQVTIWFQVVFAASLALTIWRQPKGALAMLLALVAVFVMLAWFYVPYISTVMTSTASLLLLAVPLNHAYNMAYRDDLTGLLGRRALNERLRSLGRHYVIAMLDIDHFKKFNDTYGHDAGDEVLRIVAKHIAQVGAGGIPYRYGGEEFTVLFPGAGRDECIEALEEMRRDIAVYDMTLRDHKSRPDSRRRGASKRGRSQQGKRVRVTVSIGVAERTDSLEKPSEVLKAADRALYRAKSKGRNCLVS